MEFTSALVHQTRHFTGKPVPLASRDVGCFLMRSEYDSYHFSLLPCSISKYCLSCCVLSPLNVLGLIREEDHGHDLCSFHPIFCDLL